MAICPATFQGCIDDLCYGSGCLKMGGESMLEPCPGCKQLIPIDGSDKDNCDCEPVERDDMLDDFWDDDDQ